MSLRAVVFDYGMVLTGQPDPEAYAALLRITGLPVERFESHYWVNRHAYDEGKLSGITFWQKFLEEAGLSSENGMVEKLNGWDVRMWGTQNHAMVAWQKRLKERGLLTAILSNMGDSVLAHIQQEHEWLQRFDVSVWSYQLLIAKPDPAIYRHVLQELGVRPEESLFLDDKLVNIEAAQALGMKAIQFSTVEQLRDDLVAAGLDGELPLP